LKIKETGKPADRVKYFDETWKEAYDHLRNNDSVIEVGYLFERKEAPRTTAFYHPTNEYSVPLDANPIIAVIRHKGKDYLFRNSKEVPNIVVVIDGEVVYYAFSEGSWAIYDTREFLVNLLKEVGDFEIIPPHFAHGSIIVTNRNVSHEIEKGQALFQMNKESTIRNAVLSVYKSLYPNMEYLYGDRAGYGIKIDDIEVELLTLNGQLLVCMQNFVDTKLHQWRKRGSLAHDIKDRISSILSRLVRHYELASNANEEIASLESRISDDDFVLSVFNNMEWKDFARSKDVDREATFVIIENAREFINSSQIASVTLWAAIVGAFAGVVLTLIITHIP